MALGISKFLRGKSHIVFFTCNTEKTITSKLQIKGYKDLLDGTGHACYLYSDAVKGVCNIVKLIKLYTLCVVLMWLLCVHNMCGSLYANCCCSATHSDQVFVTLWTATGHASCNFPVLPYLPELA